MKRIRRSLLLAAFATLGSMGACGSSAWAIEVLVNGNLEASVSPPGWTLTQTVTDLPGAGVSATEQISFANHPESIPGELGLYLRPFAGNEGPYADQNRPINAILSQTVAGVAGRDYTFTGHSFFQESFSGAVEFLDPASPSGAVPSPTETTFEMAFLNASNEVIGTPVTLDLRDDVTFLEWRTHTLMGTAPAGTTQVRVTAGATNMVQNCCLGQDAFLDDFSLTDSTLPTFNRLTNGNLNMVGPPLGYTLTESPPGTDNASFRDFANHTEGGAQGLWLRAFEGGDASISQTVPGVPGGEYTYSVWSFWEIGYSGGLNDPAVETTIELAFLDDTNAVIGTPLVLDLADAGQMNDSTWRQFSLSGTAPAETASVRISAGATGMYDSLLNPQSAFFDDFSLDLAVAGVPGDYNENGIVDAADYTVWRDNLGSGTSLPNDDTAGVGPDDYARWKANFGMGAAGSGAGLSTGAVPEPSTLVLVALGLVALGAIGRSNR